MGHLSIYERHWGGAFDYHVRVIYTVSIKSDYLDSTQYLEMEGI